MGDLAKAEGRTLGKMSNPVLGKVSLLRPAPVRMHEINMAETTKVVNKGRQIVERLVAEQVSVVPDIYGDLPSRVIIRGPATEASNSSVPTVEVFDFEQLAS